MLHRILLNGTIRDFLFLVTVTYILLVSLRIHLADWHLHIKELCKLNITLSVMIYDPSPQISGAAVVEILVAALLKG